MLSFETIRQLWEEVDVPLYPVRLNAQDYPQLDAQTVAFLDQVGFPEAADPGLDFTDLSERLFTHTQLYTLEDFPVLDQYLVVGATADGNPICIDTTDETIVYVDHDHGFESVFMNTSLIRLSYCMARFTAMRAAAVSAPGVDALRRDLLQADKACLAAGSFWGAQLDQLEREAGE